MKKYITVAIILVTVIAVHIFFIAPLFSSKPESPPAAAKPPLPDAAAAPVTPVRRSYKVPSRNPCFGKFFNYRRAVWDNHLPVPGCRDAQSGILVDLDTHNVLWAKNPRTGVPIASMTKMMTLLLAFEALDHRSGLKLDTPVKVSAAAAAIGGSQVYLDARETHSFGELLKTMAVKSANDSAYLIAEYLGDGDLAAFVNDMNAHAYRLRMPNTDFINAHGLPADNGSDSVSSPEGLVILAEQLLQYPLLVKWTSTRQDYFRPAGNPHRQLLTNTNRLVGKCPGVNGLKTGYTKVAGFCITATCLRNGKRLAAVVTGFKSSKARNAFVSRLLDWGYRQVAATGKSSGPGKTPKKNQTVPK
ncbi:MAG: D-alanyl-D-alanine carboxypeptidase [Victivallaceae bacterium]|nr:D-alanyl-D-alanine carboxypeptidase [Victivallaceae bacterium]